MKITHAETVVWLIAVQIMNWLEETQEDVVVSVFQYNVVITITMKLVVKQEKAVFMINITTAKTVVWLIAV